MTPSKKRIILSALASVTLLSACGSGSEPTDSPSAAGVELANGMTVQAQIEMRQEQLKKIGKAFKAISDQLKSDTPDIDVIREATALVPVEATGMADWFPEGTGPDSGVETEALPVIWEDKTDFGDKVTAMQEAATALDAAAESGDVAAVGEAFKTTGGTCKACHDQYRLDD